MRNWCNFIVRCATVSGWDREMNLSVHLNCLCWRINAFLRRQQLDLLLKLKTAYLKTYGNAKRLAKHPKYKFKNIQWTKSRCQILVVLYRLSCAWFRWQCLEWTWIAPLADVDRARQTFSLHLKVIFLIKCFFFASVKTAKILQLDIWQIDTNRNT